MITCLSLNLWRGRLGKDLVEFIRKMGIDFDILCFQEVTRSSAPEICRFQIRDCNDCADIYHEISSVLPDHIGIPSDAWRAVLPSRERGKPDGYVHHGIATFVRRSISILNYSSEFVYLEFEESPNMDLPLPRTVQCLNVRHGNERYTIGHLHGLWDHTGKGKVDTEARILQSRRVRNLINSQGGDAKIILLGDFNLDPDLSPVSLSIMQNAGRRLRNLIEETGITDTRTLHYKKYPRFADYIFVSTDFLVHEFNVLREPAVSDHAALIVSGS